ncbi:MAG: hypothetical protein M1816_002789 [Peltula sp. TS41687]|nr:MAG: hypothetical protein M1816_002789 [Peltula sp. TS41687]
MIIYTDILTGDEILADTWPMKEVENAVYEVDGKIITPTIGDIDIGANPSTEGGPGEALDTDIDPVVNVCHAFRLVKIEKEDKMDKKAYREHLKSAAPSKSLPVYLELLRALTSFLLEYMKKVAAALKDKGADEDKIKEFQTAVTKYSGKILSNYANYDLYMGNSVDPDGMHVLVDFREDGMTPYLTVWKHGLVEMKV